MIFDNHIGFLDDISTKVDVFTLSDSHVGVGDLSITKNGSPQVSFDITTDISKLKKNRVFICKNGRTTYKLIDCEIQGNLIIPGLIIKGKKKGLKFKKINLLLQGISQWMDTEGEFKTAKDKIIKTIEHKKFNANITLDSNKISISNERWFEIKNTEQSNSQINEYTIITIEAKNFSWSATELLEFITHVRTFFTLLIGHSIGLLYVLDATDKKKTNSVYFLNATRDTTDKIKARECFVNSYHLFKENMWEPLLQGYFSTKNSLYRDVWSKLSGMLSYEGFWEYQILAYVSLTDRYVSLFAENKEEHLTKGLFNKFRHTAIAALENKKLEYSNTNVVDKALLDAVIDSMHLQINENVKNTTMHSFGKKLDLKLLDTPQPIIEILNLTQTDFKHLKDIRNSVAHGDNPPIKSKGDITYEFIITNKLTLLLRYWTFIDIGFSPDDFIFYLDNWLHPTTRKAQLNNTALNIASGKYFFLEISKTQLKEAKKHKHKTIVLDYIQASNTFKINEPATELSANWYLDPERKFNSIEQVLMAFVDTKQVSTIVYTGNLYLKNGNEHLQLSTGACILNCPSYLLQNPVIKDRLRVFDSNEGAWLPSEFDKRVESLKGSSLT